MEEGRSEALSPASMKPDETCQAVAFLKRNPLKFISVHNIAIKMWSFDPLGKKLHCVDCQMGHVKRFYTTMAIDHSDTFVYCGTRTGDIVEVLIDKASYRRAGPLNRIFQGGIQQIICSGTRELLISAGDGSIARIDKKEMKVLQETKLGGSVNNLVDAFEKIYATSSKSIIYSLDKDDITSYHEHLVSTHSTLVRQIVFPKNFSSVFASCAAGDIRIWNVSSLKELLRIELSP